MAKGLSAGRVLGVFMAVFICAAVYYLLSGTNTVQYKEGAKAHIPHTSSVLVHNKNQEQEQEQQPKLTPMAVKKKILTDAQIKSIDSLYDEFLSNEQPTKKQKKATEETPNLSAIKPLNTYPALPRQNSISATGTSLELLNGFVPPPLPSVVHPTKKPVFQKKLGRTHVIFCATSGSTGTEYLSGKHTHKKRATKNTDFCFLFIYNLF